MVRRKPKSSFMVADGAADINHVDGEDCSSPTGAVVSAAARVKRSLHSDDPMLLHLAEFE